MRPNNHALRAAAAILLAGCGGSQPPIGAPGTMLQARNIGGYSTLHSFGTHFDGAEPKAALVDANGTLYGTTYAGGAYSDGTVFSVSTAGAEKVLYSFGGGADGANPSASLIAVKGALYGTTEYGGGAANEGSVFKISVDGSEHVLHGFFGYYYHEHYYYDGANPLASLIYVDGRLYGTTYSGGAGEFYGTVFRIGTDDTEKVLHSFAEYSDGANPAGALLDLKNTLYGTTELGGQTSSEGNGTIFSVRPTGAESLIYRFYPEPSTLCFSIA